jgi:site-specific DNA recombinase
MIGTLRKLEVEPQAIEQPLDLSVPENKMMLAFYLAAPEVENDRRALNVLHGMRRARKEGRWMGVAPQGYVNKITEDGKKYIAPKEPEAGIMKWAFTSLLTGQYTVLQLFKEARTKGLKVCRSNFWNLLRNPVYCGKVYVGPYKDESARFVPGLHQPIISESLFYDVQDFLDGKKKNYRTKVGSQEILQLRGYLLCPKCGKLLTGSASKGNGGQYYYYHCASSCGARFKAENANDLFCRELRKYIPRPGMEQAYARVLNAAYKARTQTQREEIKAIGEQIEAANLEVVRGRKLLLKEEIDGQDFREIKRENEQKIDMLESKLIEMTRVATNIEPLLEKAVSNLGHLDQLYKEGDVKRKRAIIGSIYPEKLTFDGFQYRTTRVNEAIELIYALDKGFTKNETGQTKEVFDLSSVVAQPGFEPRHKDPESFVLPLYYWAMGRRN